MLGLLGDQDDDDEGDAHCTRQVQRGLEVFREVLKRTERLLTNDSKDDEWFHSRPTGGLRR